MLRSLSKGPFVHGSLYKSALKAITKKEENKNISIKPIKVYSRSSVILPEFVGLPFSIHRGNSFVLLIPTENHIGHKFGEFALTRKFGGHSGTKSGPVQSNKK